MTSDYLDPLILEDLSVSPEEEPPPVRTELVKSFAVFPQTERVFMLSKWELQTFTPFPLERLHYHFKRFKLLLMTSDYLDPLILEDLSVSPEEVPPPVRKELVKSFAVFPQTERVFMLAKWELIDDHSFKL
ncbi:hypothetical protein CDAR_561661 [Caerostris darwini]|uniref:Uncharacterized protein n=1 Tax=Caerostris darwini TaxID=1538125 RepID=A0AAV4MKW4_9ARAC|nr:hypothetical protein CDAR_561661 [Caerostris darwini]